jgi:hypothetical protein
MKNLAILLCSTILAACNPLGEQTQVDPNHTLNRAGASLENASWNWTTTSNYSASSGVELIDPTTGSALGVARLSSSDSTDDTTGARVGGALRASDWSDYISKSSILTVASNKITLATSTSNGGAELDSSWAPQWSSIISYNKFDGTVGSISDNTTLTATVGANGTARNTNGSGLAYVSSKLSQGVTFDGTDDYAITTLSGTALTNASIAFWFRADSNAGTRGIFQWANTLTASFPWMLIQNNAGQLRYFTNGTYGVTAPGTLNVNQWYHVAMTRDSSFLWSAYLNGVLVGTYQGGGGVNQPNAASIYAGNGFNGYFAGAVDDVAVWSSVLTASQVALIYQRQAANYTGAFVSRAMDGYQSTTDWTRLNFVSSLPWGKPLAISAESNYGTTLSDYSSGLIGLWRLLGTPGSAIANGATLSAAVGTSATASNANTTGFAYASGNLGSGAYFDGTDDYLSVPDSSAVEPSGAFSIGFWFSTTQTGNRVIIEKDTSNGYSVQRDADNTIKMNVGSTTTQIKASGNYNDGAWHYAVFVYRGPNDGSAYIDGIDRTSTNNPGTPSYSTGVLYLGGRATTLPYNGGLEHVGLWSRALSASEVVALYRRGANRLRFQVRTCNAAGVSTVTGSGNGGASTLDCSSATWAGADGSASTFFTEFNNNAYPYTGLGTVGTSYFQPLWTSIGADSSSFNTWLSSNKNIRYIQYRALFESDEASSSTLCDSSNRHTGMSGFTSGTQPCSSDLTSVSLLPANRYSVSSETIESINTGPDYLKLSAFTATGESCATGTLTYDLGTGPTGSASAVNWKCWNGSSWSNANAMRPGGCNTSSTSAALNQNISSYVNTAGTGRLFVRVVFPAGTGTQSCQVGTLTVTGSQ